MSELSTGTASSGSVKQSMDKKQEQMNQGSSSGTSDSDDSTDSSSSSSEDEHEKVTAVEITGEQNEDSKENQPQPIDDNTKEKEVIKPTMPAQPLLPNIPTEPSPSTSSGVQKLETPIVKTVVNESRPQTTTAIMSGSEENDEEDVKEPGEKQIDTDARSLLLIKRITYIMKVIYLFLLFFTILGTGCLSRVLVHVMIWKLAPPSNSTRLVGLLGYLKPDQSHIVRDTSCRSLECSSGIPLHWNCEPVTNATCTVAEDTPSVNAAWMWSLMLSISAPYIYSFLTNASRFCTKFTFKVNRKILFMGFVRDFIHSVGLCMLTFFVLPVLSPDMAAIAVFVALCIPAILNIHVRRYSVIHLLGMQQVAPEATASRTRIRIVVAIVTVLLFLASLILFAATLAVDGYEPWTISLAVIGSILISTEWFENYVYSSGYQVNSKEDMFGVIRAEGKMLFLFAACKKEREISMLALLKVVLLNIVFLPVIVAIMANGNVNALRKLFLIPENSTVTLNTLEGTVIMDSSNSVVYGCDMSSPFIIMAICVCSTFVFFKLAQHACRIQYQVREFAVPVYLTLLAVPFILAVIQMESTSLIVQGCSVLQPLWTTSLDYESVGPWLLRASMLVGFVALVLLTLDIHKNSKTVLEKATKLFSKTSYCGLFPDLSLLLSRRIRPREEMLKIKYTSYLMSDAGGGTEREAELPSDGNLQEEMKDAFPLIIGCATMWHEEYEEMCKLLSSIFKLGRSQQEKYNNSKRVHNISPHNPGYDFDFEAHIFFDDAFVDNELGGRSLNKYAETLYEAIENTFKLCIRDKGQEEYSYQDDANIRSYSTEYGWRVEWRILGINNRKKKKGMETNESSKLIVHFKDKSKIRVKKRWSQVMYMHYLLCKKYKATGGDEEAQLKQLQQTFILALDGDVDFEPEAVDYLLKGMERNDKVGACCGRIHPIGSGPMVWYQQFEYAASHWLQKATEHVAGCVLCSPGCFTLFRGSAIVDENVLSVYSKDPKTPWQMIQYDQGEDRWLCTLLLKQGHRIEYCAAADAYTFAPEGFTEFFKQRRRWSPSTIANIMEILANWNYCSKNNDSISKLYLFYQLFLLCTAVITPGSILLLMLGAIIIGFSLEPWAALILVLIPVLLFVLSVFLFEENTQLLLASIISGIYAVVMMVVLFGIVKVGIDEGFCSETTILMCFVGGIFVIAALIHPQEWKCIFPGLLYFFAVPSVAMILMIYALGNIHVTSWGTREGASGSKKKANEIGCNFGSLCRCILLPDENDRTGRGDAPVFKTKLQDHSLNVGQTLILKAEISGYPKPQITWYKDNHKLHRSSTCKMSFKVSTVSLTKTEMQVFDKGVYSCVAENEAGKSKTEAKITVTGNSAVKPMFLRNLTKRFSGDRLFIEAEIAGYPPPEIKWMKDETTIERNNGIYKRKKTGSTLCLRIKHKDNFPGKYVCKISNIEGNEQSSLQIVPEVSTVGEKIPPPTESDSQRDNIYWKKRIVETKIMDPKKNSAGSKEQQDAIKAELKDLRNSVFFGFLIINVLYVTFIYTLTQADSSINKIAFEIPCPDGKGVLRLNPILITFVVTFGIVLMIQFWGMIYHRMSTFIQMILGTEFKDMEKKRVVKYTKPADETQRTLQDNLSRSMTPKVLATADKWRRTKLAMSFITGTGQKKTLDQIAEEV